MNFKHVMNAAMVACLMTSFLVACAPSKNEKARIRQGTGTAGDPRLQKAQEIMGIPDTPENTEFGKTIRGAQLIANVTEKTDKTEASAGIKVLIVTEDRVIEASENISTKTELQIAKDKCGKEVADTALIGACAQDCKTIMVSLITKAAERTTDKGVKEVLHKGANLKFELKGKAYVLTAINQNEVGASAMTPEIVAEETEKVKAKITCEVAASASTATTPANEAQKEGDKEQTTTGDDKNKTKEDGGTDKQTTDKQTEGTKSEPKVVVVEKKDDSNKGDAEKNEAGQAYLKQSVPEATAEITDHLAK